MVDDSYKQRMSRRDTLVKARAGLAVTAGAGLAGCLSELAGGTGDYPTNDLTLIVPFSEGGGTDIFARQVMPAVSDSLGVNIEIDNVEGAASLRGVGELFAADPDGYTFIAFNPPSTPVSAIVDEYEQDLTDLSAICSYGRACYVMFSNPEHGFETFDDIVDAYVDGEITEFAGQQIGGVNHLFAGLMQDSMPYETYIPYDGSGQVLEAVISGEAPVGAVTPEELIGPAESGNVDVIVALSSENTQAFDIPDITEEGHENIDTLTEMTRCLYFPPDTDEEYVEVMQEAVQDSLENADVQEWAEGEGHELGFQNSDYPIDIIENLYETVPEEFDLDSIREDMD